MRVFFCRLSESDREGASWRFGILLLPQQAREHRAQEDTCKVVSAGTGGKEYLTHKLSIFAWSMPVGGTVSLFCAAVFELFRPKKKRML